MEIKIVKEDLSENKSSIKEADEIKQIIKLIESKESKFAQLKEKIEANRKKSSSTKTTVKMSSVRNFKATDKLDLDMFYFTSESPTRPTMKKRTQKFLSGFYKQLTGKQNSDELPPQPPPSPGWLPAPWARCRSFASSATCAAATTSRCCRPVGSARCCRCSWWNRSFGCRPMLQLATAPSAPGAGAGPAPLWGGRAVEP
jgi:hypothetical protein